MRLARRVPRRGWIAAACAVVAAGVAALAVSVLTAGGGGAPLPNARSFSAVASLSTNVPRFGDELVARIDVAIDRHRLDPGDLRVQAPFGLLERVSHRTARSDAGRIAYVREEWTLRCLSRRCAQVQPSFAAGLAGDKGTGRRATPLPPAEVSFAGAHVAPLRLEWPVVEWLSRINQTEEANGDFFYHVDLVPPPVSYAVSPGLLLALLVLVAVPALLARRRVLARRRARAPVPVPEVPPLERALRLLERADGDDRRRALELVAVELDGADHGELVERARELAWRPPAPPAAAAGAFGDEVRSTVGGNGAVPG